MLQNVSSSKFGVNASTDSYTIRALSPLACGPLTHRYAAWVHNEHYSVKLEADSPREMLEMLTWYENLEYPISAYFADPNNGFQRFDLVDHVVFSITYLEMLYCHFK